MRLTLKLLCRFNLSRRAFGQCRLYHVFEGWWEGVWGNGGGDGVGEGGLYVESGMFLIIDPPLINLPHSD